MTETNKCEGKQITNEEIMEHLKEIEKALSLIMNVGSTLMIAEQNRINGNEENEQVNDLIVHGLLAISISLERLGDLSGFNKEIEEMKNDKKKEKLFDILDMIF